MSGTSNIVDSAKAHNGSLSFQLPYKHSGSRTLHIAKKNKKLKLKGTDRTGFKNDIWDSYLSHVNLSRELNNKLTRATNTQDFLSNQIASAKSWLDKNPEVYNGNCVQPFFGPPPDTACSPPERDKKAVALCAIAVGGCSSAANTIGQELGTSVAEYLTSQACSAYVANLKDEYYDVEDMLGTFAVDLANNAADSMLESDNGFVKILGAFAKVGVIAKKIDDFSDCVDYASFKCSKLYDKWLSKPKKLVSICNRKINLIELNSYKINQQSSDIKIIKDKISSTRRNLRTLEKMNYKTIFYND